MEWQPIDTAPRDGTVIILAAYWSSWDFEKDAESFGWDVNTGQMGTPTIFGQTGEWWADNGVGGLRLPYLPTHWMPLPTPPVQP